MEEYKSKIRSAYKQKEETALRELREVRELAIDRDGWAGFMKEPCRVLEIGSLRIVTTAIFLCS